MKFATGDLDHDVIIEDGGFSWQFDTSANTKDNNSSNVRNGHVTEIDAQSNNRLMNESWSDNHLLVSGSHENTNDNTINDILTLRSINLSVSKVCCLSVAFLVHQRFTKVV